MRFREPVARMEHPGPGTPNSVHTSHIRENRDYPKETTMRYRMFRRWAATMMVAPLLLLGAAPSASADPNWFTSDDVTWQ
jgi:hypothetical protein